MILDRRTFLKSMLASGALAALPSQTEARGRKTIPTGAVGMLCDSARCIGCRACVSACKKANDLPAEDIDFSGGYYDAPRDLSDKTKTIVKLSLAGEEPTYVKRQCMHCVDPGCVSACILGAMNKDENGIVGYDPERCIGCRYCQVACPFNVPKFQWESATPLIVKCELCRHLIGDDRIPACCEACPREAVIYGPYESLLHEAWRRLDEHPERYMHHVFGEHEAGGTQVLHLAPADLDFQDLGFPVLGGEPVPQLGETIQHGVYRGFVTPVILYAALGVVMIINRQNAREEREGGEA